MKNWQVLQRQYPPPLMTPTLMSAWFLSLWSTCLSVETRYTLYANEALTQKLEFIGEINSDTEVYAVFRG